MCQVELTLLRSLAPDFGSFPWTIIHPITPESPLYAKTRADAVATGLMLRVMFSGTDSTLSQGVYFHRVYWPVDIRWSGPLLLGLAACDFLSASRPEHTALLPCF